jgi:hypothetical protein
MSSSRTSRKCEVESSSSVSVLLVCLAMDRMIEEPARDVLKMEIARLNELQSAIYADAREGDLAAQAMYLRLADHRAKLLGLYPREGHNQVMLNVDGGGEPTIRVAFVLPPKRDEASSAAPIDVTSRMEPNYDLKALPKPPQRARTPFGALWEEPDSKGWMK